MVEITDALPAGPVATYTPDLEALKKLFSEAREASLSARRRSRKAYDYYHGDQLSADVRRVLRDRKQPEVIDNRVKPAVNGILGVLEQGQSDPRAFPRNGADNDASEIATDGLRYAAEKARWQRTKLTGARDYLVAGVSAGTMQVDEDRDPTPVHIHWDQFFADPYSRALDYADARYMGCAKWMYADRVRRMFPGAVVDVEAIGSTALLGSMDEEDEDKPNVVWGDTKRNRVLVVDVYYEDNGWKHAIFFGGAVLWAGVSEHLDEKRRPRCGIEAQACYKDKDNQPYGVVEEMIPLQDEVNMRRSRALHLFNSRQMKQVAEAQNPVKASEVRREAAKADGLIPYGWEPAMNTDMALGNVELMRDAEARLERHSPNPAVLGRTGENSSGRNNLIRQQAGLIELTPVLGGIEDFELRFYRFIWSTIRQEWNEPKWIRTTDDIGAPKFLQVNEPIMQGMVPVIDPQTGQPQFDPVTRQIAMRPNVVGVKNRPAEMDMDIIIDSTPDTANLAQEQFQELVRLAGVYGPQEVPFEDLIEVSVLPRKRQFLEKRRSRQQGPQSQPDPMALATFEATLENKRADTDAKRAKAAKDIADAAATEASMTGPLGFLVESAPPIQPVGPQPGF